MVKFLHAADLHLGHAQFEDIKRAWDFLDNLKFILDTAKGQSAEFILLSGDTFDCLELIPYVYGNVLQMIDIFKKETENKIPIICIEGNHDKRKFARGARYEFSFSWLKNLSLSNHIILLETPDYEETGTILMEYDEKSKRGNLLKINDVEIIGIGYCGEEPIEPINRIIFELGQRPKAKYRILMMHMGVKGYMYGIPALSYEVFKDLHDYIDYFALGHFHLQFEIENWVFNPGASEPVHYSERDFKRGVFFCQASEEILTDDGKFKNSVQCFKTKNRPLIYFELDARTIEDEDYLIRICNNRISRECSDKNALVYIKLRNTTKGGRLKTKETYLQGIKMNIVEKCGLLDLKFVKTTQSNDEECVRTLSDFIELQ